MGKQSFYLQNPGLYGRRETTEILPVLSALAKFLSAGINAKSDLR